MREKRKMPDDFMEVANAPYKQLKAKYKAGCTTIKAWKIQSGVPHRKRGGQPGNKNAANQPIKSDIEKLRLDACLKCNVPVENCNGICKKIIELGCTTKS